MLKFNPSTKKHAVPIACKNYGKIDLKYLLQFPDQPSHILGSTENTTFVHLSKKSKYEGHPISSDNDPIKQNLFL